MLGLSLTFIFIFYYAISEYDSNRNIWNYTETNILQTFLEVK